MDNANYYDRKLETTENGFVIHTSTPDKVKTLIKYEGNASQVTIPSEITYIGNNAFSNCNTLKEVTIPEGIKGIGSSAFSGCETLEKINIPSSIKWIEPRAFLNCKSLNKIEITGNLEYIGDSAFRGCKSLNEINLEGFVETIGNLAFFGCESLTKVIIPEGIVSINDFAFCQCQSLKEVKINGNNGNIYIGNSAFANCNSLKRIELPEGLETVGENIFSGCISLKEITIPKTVIHIEDSAFSDCSSMTEIGIPEGIKNIGNKSFYNCQSLRKITIPKSIETIGENAFESCINLKNIKYKGINFLFQPGQELVFFNTDIILKKDNLPIYFEENELATRVLKRIFRNTPPEKVKMNILDKYNEEAFLKNVELLYKIVHRENYIKDGITYLCEFCLPEEVISNIFTKFPQLLQSNIIENVIKNYEYLVSQKIFPEEELHSYYFGYSQSELTERGIVTQEEAKNKNSEYIIKILSLYFEEHYNPENIFINEIPPLFVTLVAEQTPKNRLELRDKLLLASSIPYNNKEERITVLKGNSFETICRNDERDFVEERGFSSETFFKDYSQFKGIKTSLYRKLNGMSKKLIDDLSELAAGNMQNMFNNFLDSLETVKNWDNFSSEIQRANYFRNEFVGRILYAYLKIVKQKKEEFSKTHPEAEFNSYDNAFRSVDFTKPETLRLELFYKNSEINIIDIIREATKRQEELFDDSELIETMLMINPYSYDALRNFHSKEQSEFVIYANLAKRHGYLFKREEKEAISAKINAMKASLMKEKSIKQKKGEDTGELDNKLTIINGKFGKDFMSIEGVDHFIEYVNNRLGLTKVPKDQKEKYLKEMERIITQYIAGFQEKNIIDILRTIDLYCRINNEAELQTTQGYKFSSETLFDATRIEDFSHADRIMYCLFLMNKLAHNSKDINLLANIKDDYRFSGYNEHSLLLRKALDGYNKLGKYGLTMDFVNVMLSAFEQDKSNNILRQYLNNASPTNITDSIDLWAKFSESIYYALKAEQSRGTITEKKFPTDVELKELINAMKAQLPSLSDTEKEMLKILLSSAPIELTKEERAKKEILEQKKDLTESENNQLKKLKNKVYLANLLNNIPLSNIEKNKLIELKAKLKKYELLKEMGLSDIERYKLTPEEIDVLNDLNNRQCIEILKKIKQMSTYLLPITSLSEKEIQEIKVLAEEYMLFFEAKTILANNLINLFISQEKQTLLSALSLDEKGKKSFYKKHGYIIEIQETEIGPTLVCLNKKLSKPFSIHLKDLPEELEKSIQERIKMTGLTSTIAHVQIESSTQYPTLKVDRVSKPNGRDLANVNISMGFNSCKGDKEWRDYLVLVYNYAKYDYDEFEFIKKGLESSQDEQRQNKLGILFSIIRERLDNDPEKISVISKTFAESLSQNGYDLTYSEFQNILKKQCLKSQELLLGNEYENKDKLEQLIELYTEYNPDMVEIVTEEKEGKQVQQIYMKSNEEKTITIDTSSLSQEAVERIMKTKRRHQQEEQAKKTMEQSMMATNIEINLRNILHTMSEIETYLECNRNQMQTNQVTASSKK